MEKYQTFKIKLSPIVFLLTIALVISSCNYSSTNQSNDYIIDINSNSYIIKNHNLEYNTDSIENYIIANPENLPENFLMCIVDTVNNVCLTILETHYRNKNTITLTKSEVDGLINDIIRQDTSLNAELKKQSARCTNYMGKPCWKFDAIINLPSANDTTAISYRGNIFDTPNGICSIIFIHQILETEKTNQTQLAEKWLSKLKYIDYFD